MELRGNVRRVSTRPLVLLVALVSALALALVIWLATLAQAPAPAAPDRFQLQGVGAQQAAHNRSEKELGAPPSVGSQQAAHGRSEEGLVP